jgi:hypothetical protein
MSSFYDAPISFFHGATNAQPAQMITIGAALEAIKTGAYRAQIERLRHLRTSRGQAVYNAAKRQLDAVTFGGTFAPTRSKAALVQHSGLVHGDIDHLDDAQALKARLCVDAYIVFCFISPSGDGLKLDVLIPPVVDDNAYKHAWQTVADYFQAQYGVTWDPSGKDVSRLCFLSWDPDLYVHPNAQLFPVPPVPAAVPHRHTPPTPRRTVPSAPWRAVPSHRRDYYARQAIDTAVRMIDSSTPGNRHFWRRRAAYLLGGYVAGGILTADEARTALEPAVARNTAHFERSMQTIDACLAAGMQDVISLEELDQKRRQWRATHWHTRARAWTGQIQTVAPEELPPWR